MLSILGSLAHGLLVLVLTYALLYLGIVWALAVLNRPVVMPGGQVVRARFNAWLPRWLRHDGFSLFGINWIADRSAPPDLLAHEYRHSMQERRLGYLLYPPIYFWHMWRDHGYWADAMEADARAYSRARVKDFVALPIAPDLPKAA